MRRRAAEARAWLGLAGFHAGDLSRARDAFARALALWPGHPCAGYYLARIHHRCGQPGEALEALEEAGLTGAGIEHHLLRAVCLEALNERGAARRALDAALEKGLAQPLGEACAVRAGAAESGSDPPGRWLWAGTPRRASGSPAAVPRYADDRCRIAARLFDRFPGVAAAHLEAALAINPRYLRARLMLALLKLRLGQVSESLAHLERARELEPGYPDVQAWLGLARLTAGDGRGAARALERAAAMRREFARAHRFLALVHHAAGRTREALEEARRGLTRARDVPDSMGPMRLPGLEAETAGEEELLRSLGIRPGCADLHLALGRSRLRDGAPREARGAFQRALELQPGYAAAMFELARVESTLGRLPEAESLLARLSRTQPGWVDAQALLGRVRLRMHDAPGAVAPLRAALRTRPGLAAARADLAWALQALGRSPGAARVSWWEPVRPARAIPA